MGIVAVVDGSVLVYDVGEDEWRTLAHRMPHKEEEVPVAVVVPDDVARCQM